MNREQLRELGRKNPVSDYMDFSRSSKPDNSQLQRELIDDMVERAKARTDPSPSQRSVSLDEY